MRKWLEAKKIKGKFYIDSSDFSNIVKEYSDKIDEIEEENKKLKESLDIATKCSSKEEDGIIRLSEENKKLKDENVDLKSELSKFRDSFKKYRDYEKEELAESCYDLARENKKLKEMYNVYVTGTLKLKEKNKKLKNKIKNWKIIRGIISDCIMLAFLCFMCSGMLCMLFQMIVDVIMGFQFVRYA